MKSILYGVLCSSIWVGMIAFSTWGFDPSTWDGVDRFGFILVYVVAFLSPYSLASITEGSGK